MEYRYCEEFDDDAPYATACAGWLAAADAEALAPCVQPPESAASREQVDTLLAVIEEFLEGNVEQLAPLATAAARVRAAIRAQRGSAS